MAQNTVIMKEKMFSSLAIYFIVNIKGKYCTISPTQNIRCSESKTMVSGSSSTFSVRMVP